MKKLIYAGIIISILLTGCRRSKEISYDTLYQVSDSLPKITEPIDISIENDGYSLKITESAAGQEKYGAVSGTDGTNFYHEVYAYTLTEVLTGLTIGMGRVKIIEPPGYPPMDFHYKSANRHRGAFDYELEFNNVLMPLLSDLFKFELTKKDLPITTYIVEVYDETRTLEAAVEIDRDKYIPSPGLISGSVTNINEKDGVYYGTIDDFVSNMNYYPGLADQYFITVGETGDNVYALPLTLFEESSKDSGDSKEIFFQYLKDWGFSVTEGSSSQITYVFDFGEL